MYRTLMVSSICAGALVLIACETQSTAEQTSDPQTATDAADAAAQQHGQRAAEMTWSAGEGAGATDPQSPYGKPGFTVEQEDNVLWVLEPGQKKSDKAVTLVGAGPDGRSIRAVDRETAMEYLAAKPGFNTMVEDGRIWVLKPGESPKDKNVTLVGAGPRGMSIRANDRETAMEYLVSKPGFNTMVEDGRIWVLKPGESPKDKNVTLIGAGPQGMSVRANSRETAVEYLTAKPGFETHLEDGRLWVLRPGQKMSDKSITRVGAGPMGMSLRAVDAETLNEYLAR